jgi:hypothetical protein
MFDKTARAIKALQSRPQIQTPIATDMFIPNLSGDHSGGIVLTTPTESTDIVNKAYADSLVSALHPSTLIVGDSASLYTSIFHSGKSDVPFGFSSATQSFTTGGLWRVVCAAGVLRWDSNTAVANDFSTRASPMTLTASGQMAINQNSAHASSALDVYGNLYITNSTHLVYNNASGGVIDWTGTLYLRSLSSTGDISTYTNRVLIDSNGLDVRWKGRFLGSSTVTTVVTPLTASAAEFRIAYNSLLTIGDTAGITADPTITFYRTSDGTGEKGDAFRITASNSIAKIGWNTASSTAYGSDVYTNAALLFNFDRAGKFGIGRVATTHVLEVEGAIWSVGSGASVYVGDRNNAARTFGFYCNSATEDALKVYGSGSYDIFYLTTTGTLRVVEAMQTPAIRYPSSTPSTMSGDVNNYDLGNKSFIRLSGGAADRIITGIVAQSDGHIMIICNIGTTNKISFANESASSTAANRIITTTAGTIEIPPYHSVTFIYDATTARWRELTHL